MSTPEPSPSPPTPDPDAHDAPSFRLDGLCYQLDRLPERHGKKSVVTVRLDGAPDDPGPPLVDRVDLFAFKGRRAFAGLVADAFGRQTGEIQGHLALVLDAIERALTEVPTPRTGALTPERRAAAERLLAQPDLLEQAAAAMTTLGYVGEEESKRLCYLVATSRLLRQPLSVILMAPSGCGKSELLDVVARLLPDEAVEFLSRLTPQALFYAGEDSLRHKVVMVDEAAGTSGADYSLRTLQSKGFLTLRVPAKGADETFTVHGPIALMSATTSSELDPENLSRCLELSLDDSPAQTERIQRAQREAWEGQPRRAVQLQTWQDAQRLLEPRRVVIPFATKLRFPARTTTDRRGNQKLLGLVAAHALLHQRQRERQGERVLATTQDYQVVHALLSRRVEHDLDGLSPRATRVYQALAEQAPGALTRREIAERMGWVYNTARKALVELVQQELAAVADDGPPARYRLLDRSSLLSAAGALVDPATLGPPSKTRRRPAKPKPTSPTTTTSGAGHEPTP